MSKTCSRCSQTKLLTEFYARGSWCRTCNKTICKAYYEARKRRNGKLVRPRNPIINGLKNCRQCNTVKLISEFWKHGKFPGAYCKICASEAGKAWYKENKRKDKDWKLRRTYGLTIDQYEQILARQNYKCAICKVSNPKGRNGFNVDHCHETSKIRGLLCSNCNIGIGNLQHDPDILRAALKYLEV
jgi:hypothetical protein